MRCPIICTRKAFDTGVEKVMECIESTTKAAIDKGVFHYLTIGHTPTTNTRKIILLEEDITGSAFQAQVEIV